MVGYNRKNRGNNRGHHKRSRQMPNNQPSGAERKVEQGHGVGDDGSPVGNHTRQKKYAYASEDIRGRPRNNCRGRR